MIESDDAMILIVDDTEAFIDIVVDTLEASYQLCVCTNGKSALEIAESEQPDLILLDVLMPDMNGYEVCERLKGNPLTQDIPVIFLTVKSNVDDERRGFDLGGVDYISKPISPHILEARVKTHLEIRDIHQRLKKKNNVLKENVSLREDVERMSRHDLKNPLTAILGSAELMLMRGRFDEASLRRIVSAGYDMLDMINRSMNLYKMEKGTYAYQPSNVNIGKLVHKIINECDALTQDKGLNIQIFFDGMNQENFIVQAEELLSYSMLNNLIHNAIEASPNHEHIIIALGWDDKKPYIRIRNRGAVDASIRDTFFDRYVTSGKEGGTGLGTYSSKLMAEAQGGDIALDILDETYTQITVTFSSEIQVS